MCVCVSVACVRVRACVVCVRYSQLLEEGEASERPVGVCVCVSVVRVRVRACVWYACGTHSSSRKVRPRNDPSLRVTLFRLRSLRRHKHKNT